MDTTATLAPPAAHAGPAPRRRDGPATEGFAGAMRQAELPGAAAVPRVAGPAPAVADVGNPATPGIAADPAPASPHGPQPILGPPAKLPAVPQTVPSILKAGQAAAPPVPGLVPVPLPVSEPAAAPELELSAPAPGQPGEAETPEATLAVAVPAAPALPIAPPLPGVLPQVTGGGDAMRAAASPPPAAPPPAAHGPIERQDRSVPAATPAALAGMDDVPRTVVAAPDAGPTTQPRHDLPSPVAPAPTPAGAAAAPAVPVAEVPATDRIILPDTAVPRVSGAPPAPQPGPPTVSGAAPGLPGAGMADAAARPGPPLAAARGPQADPSTRSAVAPGIRAVPRPADRPMLVAAAAGQAVAIQAKADAEPSPAPAAPLAEATVERIAEPLPLAGHSAFPALPSHPGTPAPAAPGLQSAEAGSAAPAGLSPAPAASPADPPLAARPTMAPQPPPTPPPARQVAQVAIALSLGSGQAPRLTVALEPEALGRVEICIERGADGEAASVRVLAERPETLALLQRDARELGRALSGAGVPLAAGALQFGLSSGDPNQGGRQPGAGSGGAGGWTGRGAPLPAEATRPASLALSLLDIAV